MKFAWMSLLEIGLRHSVKILGFQSSIPFQYSIKIKCEFNPKACKERFNSSKSISKFEIQPELNQNEWNTVIELFWTASCEKDDNKDKVHLQADLHFS